MKGADDGQRGCRRHPGQTPAGQRRHRDPANRNIDTWQATSTSDGRSWQQRRLSTRSWNPDLGFFTSGAFIGDDNGLAASNRAARRRSNGSPSAAGVRSGIGEPIASRPRPTIVFALSHQGGDTMPTSGAGQPGLRWPGWEGRLWPWLLPVLVLMVTGCAQPGSAPARAAAATTSPPSATLTVGPDDGGRTVDLKVGDRLIVELNTITPPSRFRPAWTLRSPPSTVLQRVPGGPDATRVVLVADRPGTVRLVLVKRFGCDPPLRCPVAGPSTQSERMRPPLQRATVVITVRVR